VKLGYTNKLNWIESRGKTSLAEWKGTPQMFSLRTVFSRRKTSYTTGATRKRHALFSASFRCLSRLKLKKTIILNFSGDSALLAGYDSLSLNFESGGVYRVWLREPVRSTSASGWARWEDRPPENVETDDDESSLNSDKYCNVDCKSCIYKSRPTNTKLALITMFKLARS